MHKINSLLKNQFIINTFLFNTFNGPTGDIPTSHLPPPEKLSRDFTSCFTLYNYPDVFRLTIYREPDCFVSGSRVCTGLPKFEQASSCTAY